MNTNNNWGVVMPFMACCNCWLGVGPLVMRYVRGSQSLISGSSVSPEILLEVQALGPCSRTTKSETLGVRPSICTLISPSGDSEGC